MSSKTGARVWSIRLRLTLWFGLAAGLLAGGVAGANYWLLEAQRAQDADEWLAAGAEYLHAARCDDPAAYARWTGPDEPVRVIDPDHRVRYESPAMGDIAPAETFPRPGAPGADRSVGGKRYRLFSSRIDGWTYQLVTDQTADVALFARFRHNLLLAITPTVAIGLLGGALLTWRGLRPLREVATTVRGIAPGRLGDRISVAALPTELRAVADAFNGVMDRLQDAFARLDQFAADVAHELRTPVHNLRGGIEVALGQDRTPGDYRRALGAALNEADRLGRLVDRLLFLAQAEDPRREVRREATDVAAELTDVREFFAPVAAEAGVAVRRRGRGHDLSARPRAVPAGGEQPGGQRAGPHPGRRLGRVDRGGGPNGIAGHGCRHRYGHPPGRFAAPVRPVLPVPCGPGGGPRRGAGARDRPPGRRAARRRRDGRERAGPGDGRPHELPPPGRR
ncbi:hypothetical protein FTUN_4011 [Frigoriglobus tundricola]|uniref:histidine kinase n=1 Tax=Frigoriglobus tundricola TaxID=2774151 RepID=A0A6M5YSQ0_9BACT|nr:histidine kinase dimerization/phospho-acceptor domain-containing protein [Frigoriglobus tundricola]QJW96454.1 hypothetical protein FTUN_4011 [Frigoriglobus tundricola]